MRTERRPWFIRGPAFGPRSQEVGNIRHQLAIVGLVVALLAVAASGVGASLRPSAGTTGESTTIATGAQTVTASFPMDVHVAAEAAAAGCENAPGPKITLTGEIALGGVGVKLIFTNNAKGTHTHEETSTATAVVIPAGESISIPKQPVWGGTGGNPFIYLQFLGSDGKPLSSEIFLGRCVQGLSSAAADFAIPSTAMAEVSGGSCDNQGSTVSLSGELRLSGINARLVFRNNDNPVGGPHEASSDVSVDVVLLPEGQTIEFAKQPPLGGAGGNPWISLVFLDEEGAPVSGTFLLGRCVQDF